MFVRKAARRKNSAGNGVIKTGSVRWVNALGVPLWTPKSKAVKRKGSARKPARKRGSAGRASKDYTTEYRALAARARAKGIKFNTRQELYKALNFSYPMALDVETNLLRNRYENPKTAEKVAKKNLKSYSYI